MPKSAKLLRPQWAAISQKEFRSQYQELTSLYDLADLLGVKPRQLSYYAYHVDKKQVYSTFDIPKRFGKPRRIDKPSRTLKYIQRLIHESLTRVYGPHRSVHGFVSGRSIVTNAREHLGKKYVLNVDLADFFPSVTGPRIYSRLKREPYSIHPKVAHIIASLATNGYNQLPQGGPSSPVIANIVASGLDSDLADLCASLYCRYTRYADDITISTSRSEMSPHIARYPNAWGTNQVIIGDRLNGIIEKHGFRLNKGKNRLQSYWTRQLCTGLVVNGKRASPPRPYVRRLRSLVDHWKKEGWIAAATVLQSAEGHTPLDDRDRLLNHVLGRIAYLKMVRGQDDCIAKRLESIVTSLPPGY